MNLNPKILLRILVVCMGIGLVNTETKACDVCAIFSAVTPNAQNSIIGMYFRHRAFSNSPLAGTTGTNKVQHDPGSSYPVGVTPEPGELRESYTTALLYARWFANENWMFSGQLPLTYNTLNTPYLRVWRANLADAQVMAHRALVNRSIKGHFVRVFAGLGLKAPTGSRYDTAEHYQGYFELQGTTGSWDIVTNLEAAWRKGNIGVQTITNYRINTRDAFGNRYANFFNVNAAAFYLHTFKNQVTRLMPSLGCFVESYNGRFYEGNPLEGIGGTTMMATAALGLYGEHLSIRPEIQVPFFERLNGDQLSSHTVFTLDFAVAF